jgi:hypothetical protein
VACVHTPADTLVPCIFPAPHHARSAGYRNALTHDSSAWVNPSHLRAARLSISSSRILQKLAADGTFQPVRATLRSNPYATVSVLNGTTSTLSYEFETDGVIVTVGQGDLDVVIDVDEIPAACTPLESSCGDGLWCPPPELTGAPLACRTAGSVAIAGACNDTSHCVANAACFDLGSGSVCVELCGALDAGLPCASGGVCQAAGNSYGICR